MYIERFPDVNNPFNRMIVIMHDITYIYKLGKIIGLITYLRRTLHIHQVTNKTYRQSSTKFTIQQPDRAAYLV